MVNRTDRGRGDGGWGLSALADCLPRRSADRVDLSASASAATSASTSASASADEDRPRRLSSPLSMLRRPRHRRVPLISTTSLFNRLQTSGVVLLDCRKPEAFAALALPGALLWPPPARGRGHSVRSVDAALALAGNALLARKLAARDLLEVVVIGGNKSPNSLLYRLDWGYRVARLLADEGRVFSVKFLAQGFPAFVDKYGFMAVAGGGLGDSMNSTRSNDSSAVSSDDGVDAAVDAADAIEDAMVDNGGRVDKARERVDKAGGRVDIGGRAEDADFFAAPKGELPYPNEILDGFLFLGNCWQANSLSVMRALKITHVVNLGAPEAHRQRFPNVKYLDVDVQDHEREDIGRAFAPALEFIEQARQERADARVLVHCVQGVSRSSSVAILYVMRHKKCTLSAAYSHVLKCRPLIFPNRGFMAQLLAAEQSLYGGASVAEDDLDALQNGLLPPVDRRGSALVQTFL